MERQLEQYGWSARLAAAFAEVAQPGDAPARVVKQTRGGYEVATRSGTEERARLSGPLKRASGAERPAVGDWVAVIRKERESRLAVRALVPRLSAFTRRAAGAVTREQVVAANVDVVFLVAGLDHDFNPRRIERYVTLAWDSGATPVIVLNKADLWDEATVEARRAAAAAVAPGVEVLTLSARLGQALEPLRAALLPGVTGAFLGSSGVGKSTLVNRLVGAELMPTGEVREDDSRGRHTTSHRQLVLLPWGGLVIDTPGMRELQLWAEEDSLEGTFADVTEVAADCHFRDCRHEREPGCAVRAAVAEGRLDSDRLESFYGLRLELESLVGRQAEAARLQERRRGRQFSRMRQEVRRTNPKYK